MEPSLRTLWDAVYNILYKIFYFSSELIFVGGTTCHYILGNFRTNENQNTNENFQNYGN